MAAVEEDQHQRGVEACPQFHKVVAQAKDPKNHFYWQDCATCPVGVIFDAHIDVLKVEGFCPGKVTPTEAAL